MKQLHTASRTAARFALAACLAIGLLAGAAASARSEKRIYIANDDHTDYFWTADDVQYRSAFLDMLDYYMAQAEATATNPSDSRGRFNCDGSLWVWEYEHNQPPSEFARLIGHLRAGTISMPLNPAALCYGGTPAEAVLRGMYYAGRLERRFDLRFPLVAAMENQTLPAGIASLWAGSGARYSWRGVCGCATNTVYRPRPREIYNFLGPDGQGVCMKWNTMASTYEGIGGYAEAAFPATIVNYLDNDATFRSRWPWDVSAAFGYGGDRLETMTSAFITASQQHSNPNRRVIVSNEVDFFEDFLASYGDQIPNFSGSFGNEWELHQASLAAVTAAFRRAIEKLRAAEALATIAAWRNPAFLAGRETARDAAFMAAGLFYEHDWTADGPVPASQRAQFQRDELAKLESYVNALHADALAALAADVSTVPGTERHLVFNPLSWSRTDVADLATAVPEPRLVVDVGSGAEVPSQSVAPGVVRILASDVPSVGYRVYEVLPGPSSTFVASASVTLPAFDNGLYLVTLGARGQLTSLLDHRDNDRELVRAGAALNDLGVGNGPVVLESTGPVSTTLSVTAAGAPAHRTRVTLYAGVDRVEIENTITQNFSDPLMYASAFELTGATLRHEEVGMIARVARAAQGGDYADENARTDYLTFGHFADFSLASRGVTLSNADGSFFQAGNSTTDELDSTTPSLAAVVGMRIDVDHRGIPNQGGDSQFLNRFALRRHGAFDGPAAMRFALEHQNPLVPARLTGGAAGPLPGGTFSFVSLPSADLVLWALKPAEEGIGAGIVARVWNLAEGQRTLQLSLPLEPQFAATRTTHVETDLAPASVVGGALTDVLARQEMRTYRLVPESGPLGAGPDAPQRGGLSLAVYPNPLGREPAAIAFRLGAAGRVSVRVRDVRGATLATLHDGALAAGPHTFAWDRRGGDGGRVPPGVYFVEVQTPAGRAQRRLAVLD